MGKRKRKKTRLVQQVVDPPWTPFEPAELPPEGKARRQVIEEDPDEVYLNNLFQVEVHYLKPGEGGKVREGLDIPYIIHLSFKRRDRQPFHDWRIGQRIKNEILGPETEAMELYPAESRLMDTSNQYHLWALPPGYTFPWGYLGRSVSEQSFRGSVQRPFPADARPADLDEEDPEEKFKRAQTLKATEGSDDD